ncbi:MAG: uracil-DNA glycosylase [Candidatus Brocadiia bacterium]
MGSDLQPRDPRQELSALARAVAARLELERGFGIESWALPRPQPPTPPAKASRKGARPGKPRGPARPSRPKTRPTPPAKPQVSMTVRTESAVDMFRARDYEVEIPEGLTPREQLDHFAGCIAECALCPLHAGRKQVVFGAGNAEADLMFIGEAPGRDEDRQGIPFVGRAGQLLTRIIEAIEFTREEVYIANIAKCRPPGNRAPTPEEMAACLPFLLRQVAIIQPKVICLLGATALRGLLQVKDSISKVRGQFIDWNGTLVMPTYHPAYLLRNPHDKRKVWEDVQKVRDAVRAAR